MWNSSMFVLLGILAIQAVRCHGRNRAATIGCAREHQVV